MFKQPVVKLLTVLVLLVGSISWAAAQTCPHQLLFSYGEIYYYNGKNCATGQIIDEVYTFTGPIATGCGANNQCNSNASPYTLMFMPMVVGDPPPEYVLKALPPEASIMVPFGGSKIALTGGYPKFVQGQINGANRIFKIYHVSYTDDARQRRDLRIGMEVTGVPAGQQAANVVNLEVVSKRVKLTVEVAPGQTAVFEALHQLQ